MEWTPLPIGVENFEKSFSPNACTPSTAAGQSSLSTSMMFLWKMYISADSMTGWWL